MAKYCPETGDKVIYLQCIDCDPFQRKACREGSVPATPRRMENFNISAGEDTHGEDTGNG
jgi:hypothetical protein